MIITVWRHGEAGPAHDDRLRELTARGNSEVALGARRLRAVCEQRKVALPDALWYSRWQRTTQTANLVSAEFPDLRARSEDALVPAQGPSTVEHALEPLWQTTSPPLHLVLVSHQPLVSALVDHLTGQRGAIPPHPPGGLVTLSLDAPAAGCAGLLWWAFPPAYEASV